MLVLEEEPELPELPVLPVLLELPELEPVLEEVDLEALAALEALAEAAAARADDEAWAEAPEPSRLANAEVSGARALPRRASECSILIG